SSSAGSSSITASASAGSSSTTSSSTGSSSVTSSSTSSSTSTTSGSGSSSTTSSSTTSTSSAASPLSCKTCPGKIRKSESPLADINALYDMPCSPAIPKSVSPGCTVYVSASV